jgi:outer membrane protein assembly factor BamB
MTFQRWGAFATLGLLLGLAACDKDKDVDPPAELVDVRETVHVQRIWSEGLGDEGEKLYLSLGLTLQDGTLYAAARDGVVLALDPDTGRSRWRSDTKLPLAAGPGAGSGLVVVGTNDGDVAALDAQNGQRRWKIKVSSEVLAAPLVTGDKVVIRTVDGRLRALSAADGHELWMLEEQVPRLSLRGTGPPVAAGDTVLCGFDTGKLVAASLSTGETLWQTQVSTPRGRTELERLADLDAAVQVSGNDVYAVGYQGRIAMLGLDTGQIWWGRDVSSYRALALDDEQIYVADSNGSVLALRRRDGSTVWQQDGLLRRKLSAPARLGNTVAVGDFEGYLHFLDRNTGTFVAREHPGDGQITTLLGAEEKLFALDEGGRLVAYRIGGKSGG